MRLIFLGAPGSGKGTQASYISEKLGIPHISTGDIIRAAIKEETELGKKAKDYIEKGLLVPDELVIGMVADRLMQPDCESGFILDGFPRTVPQAEALEKMGICIDKVIGLEVSDKVILERITGRRQCSMCGATYHVTFNPSKEKDVCDICGNDLIIRKDDNEETVKNRLKVYYEQTEPLNAYYKDKGLLVEVDSNDSVNKITANILNVLGVE